MKTSLIYIVMYDKKIKYGAAEHDIKVHETIMPNPANAIGITCMGNLDINEGKQSLSVHSIPLYFPLTSSITSFIIIANANPKIMNNRILNSDIIYDIRKPNNK